MVLYGHRADKEIGQIYRLYSLNSVKGIDLDRIQELN